MGMSRLKGLLLASLVFVATGANAGLSNVYEIKITLSDLAPTDRLQVSELVAFGTLTQTDLALLSAGAQASSSSNWINLPANEAIDGIIGDPNNLYHSGVDDSNPFLSVFLNGEVELDYLTIFGRNGYKERDIYNVELFDSNKTSLFTAYDLSADNDLGRVTVDLSSVSAVPEPSTLALMALGLAGIGFAARRRQA